MDSSEEFPFPFEPYSIQVDFMRELYRTLENGKLGIFESPTGTGKSLSLCCGAIKWLKDHNINKQLELTKQIDDKTKANSSNDVSGDDWLNSDYERIKRNDEIFLLRKKLESIQLQKKRINEIKVRKASEHSNKINKKRIPLKIENKNLTIDDNVQEQIDLCEDHDLLLNELEEKISDDEEVDSDNENNDMTKIYFCSRTHSQLSQFVNEIKRTSHKDDVSVVSLASRQIYCINTNVNKLKSQHLINERCLELQKNKNSKTTSKSEDGKIIKRAKTSSNCCFYNQTNIETLKENIQINIMDVEDLLSDAKSVKACPYYGARAAVKDSQIIVVPYQTILHKSTRKANGINLKNHIVIVDEAHNLLETIAHIYSSEINGKQLQVILEKLNQYKNKFISKFAAKTLLNLNQIIHIVTKLLGMLRQSNDVKMDNEIYSVEEFVIKAKIDNFNLRPLLDFCFVSKLAQKLHGFSEKYPKADKENPKASNVALQKFLCKISKKQINPESTQAGPSPEEEKYVSVGNSFQCFAKFLECLTSTYSDGRIITSKAYKIEDAYHKFLLLNPAAQFSDIINEARSVIVAGGTMQPFSEFRQQLFITAGASFDRIIEFSCGHVIPSDNILPICLSEGPSMKKLNFTYELRKSPEMLNEIGRILLNLCNIVPGGIVCFFPSYDYEKTVFNYMSANGTIKKIENKKKVYREPKTTAQTDKILEEYGNVIKNCNKKDPNKGDITGALMLSVVGGKLSEGLNFSDDLGRCVLVIGLPYPNLKSVELQEKMKYLNNTVSTMSGNLYYENLCIKAVNQCIGRAVRHAKDYATVILVDERYSKENIVRALPKWIQVPLINDCKFGAAFSKIRTFFSLHK